jgi:hypothetical protein
MGHPGGAHGGFGWTGRGPQPDLSEGRERFGVGPIATEIVVMSRKDRRILGGNSRGPNHHDTVIQNGMDNHEWDMEPPPKGLGSYPGHTIKDPGLMQIGYMTYQR